MADIAILTGTTASGKTEYALKLAEEFPEIEIINADSLLVYQEMNIGTAKPSQEELSRVPHHLVDIESPAEKYTAGNFYRAVQKTIHDIHERKKKALIVGGTGFYLKALIYGLWEGTRPADPKLREELESLTTEELYSRLQEKAGKQELRITPNDRYRQIRALEVIETTGRTPADFDADQENKTPDPRFRLFIIDRENTDLHERIRLRTRKMLNDGFIDEVISLQAKYPLSKNLLAVGYKQVGEYLRGEKPKGRQMAPGISGLEDEIHLATRHLVKKQRTWFRGQTPGNWYILDRDRDALQKGLREVYVNH